METGTKAALTVSRGPLPEESAEVTPAEMVQEVGGGGGGHIFYVHGAGNDSPTGTKIRTSRVLGEEEPRGWGGGGKKVSCCFTPSQPVRLYQGGGGGRRSEDG